MTNRFPGKCAKCKALVPANAGTYSKGAVYCPVCEPKKAEGPLRIVVTRVDGGFCVAPSGHLGDRFQSYITSVAGLRFHSEDKSQRTADVALLGRAIARLQEVGLDVDVAPDVVAAIQATQAQVAGERQAADERAAVVNAELSKRGLSLFPFQQIGVPWLAPRLGALLGDDMGLGKTIQALTAIPKGARVLVVAPAVAKGVWVRETKKWRPDLTPVALDGHFSFRWPEPGELVVLNYDILPPVVAPPTKSKGEPSWVTYSAARGARLPYGVDAWTRFCAVWESIGQAHVAQADWWRAFTKVWPKIAEAAWASSILDSAPEGLVAIADEAHTLKGGNKTLRGSRWKAIKKAVRERSGRSWLVTATPLLNRPQELWTMLTMADLEREAFGSWKSFLRIAGGTEGRFGIEWDPGAIDTKAISEGLGRVMLRRLKTEVLKDLPAKTYSEITVDLPAKARRICDEAEETIRARGISLAEALEVASQTRNTKPGFETFSRARAALATAKLDAALELVESYEEAGEPLVVFSDHRAPIDVIAKRPGWAAITGDVSAAERTQIEERFQAGELKGVACTVKAGGVAITLTRACNALFVDLNPVAALNVQAEDRIYRIGTSKPVTITVLVADHALDTRINDLLSRKRAFMTRAVDAAKRGATEVPVEQAADFDRAARELEASRAKLEADLAQQRKDRDARRKAWEEEGKAVRERIQREQTRKYGKKAAQSLRSRGASNVADDEYVDADFVRREPATEREIWASVALASLAGMDGDHATHKNYEGFNKADQSTGHGLAERVAGGLTNIEWDLAIVVCAKYWRQVGPLPGGPIDRAERGVA